ncbi:MAG: EpsI family protein, partial [Novosphingobium sp.]
MIDRRELLFGGACVAALGTGLALRPRKMKTLMGEEEIGTIIPRRFGPWVSHDGGDIVTPKTPGSLADRLYSQTVTRTYFNE